MIDTATTHDELGGQLKLNRDYVSTDEQLLLSFVFSDLTLKRLAHVFFSQYDLTDAQWDVLMTLWDYRNEGIHQFEVASILLVNRASVGGVIDRLVDKRLVQRRQDESDRRANYVGLTPQGKRLVQRVKKPYYALLPKLFAGMNQTDKRQLLALLSTFRRNIGRMTESLAQATS